MAVIERVLALLAPHECVGCGAEDHLLCATCYFAQQRAPAVVLSSVQQVWPGVVYAGIAKAVVYNLKFERAAAAARDIADHMALTLPAGASWIVTHVPTAPARIRQRGYDQAERIARRLAVRIGAPYLPLLARQSAARQVGSTRRERRAQMQHAFRPLRLQALQNQHVLVVDDVLTTGATMQAAARTLRAAGARQVSAAVFASAPSRLPF